MQIIYNQCFSKIKNRNLAMLNLYVRVKAYLKWCYFMKYLGKKI